MVVRICDGPTIVVRAFGNKPDHAAWRDESRGAWIGQNGGSTPEFGPNREWTPVHSLLFIEDDDHIRLALRLALEDEGYDVVEAPDGRTGLTLFDGADPDLVLLDLRLPDVSGF